MRYNIDGYFNKSTVVKLKAIIENETYLDFHFDYANAGANNYVAWVESDRAETQKELKETFMWFVLNELADYMN